MFRLTWDAAGHGIRMCGWKNGARCRDGVKYCGIIPTLFCCFSAIPSLHALVFISKLMALVSIVFVFVLRREKREEEGGEGGRGGGGERGYRGSMYGCIAC